ncbi:MAG: hypothetical protein P9L88_05035 [Candidatus Tantalella remota]|nr:hypothetical protein [Candidatus Tantalella remota]
MKKIIVLAVIMVFALGMVSAFAATDHRPISKSISQGTFQGAADHIEKWGDSAPAAKEMSLRGNKEELKKRRTQPCAKAWQK